MQNQDAGSLDNLRDIVVAPPVSWWPPAPGWWIVAGGVCVAAVLIASRQWLLWKRNAYRRAALLELTTVDDDAAVVQILKRAAISAYGRSVGSLSGDRWCQWLSETANVALSPVARDLLEGDVYRSGQQLTPELLQFARQWINLHQSASKLGVGGMDHAKSSSTEGQRRT